MHIAVVLCRNYGKMLLFCKKCHENIVSKCLEDILACAGDSEPSLGLLWRASREVYCVMLPCFIITDCEPKCLLSPLKETTTSVGAQHINSVFPLCFLPQFTPVTPLMSWLFSPVSALCTANWGLSSPSVARPKSRSSTARSEGGRPSNTGLPCRARGWWSCWMRWAPRQVGGGNPCETVGGGVGGVGWDHLWALVRVCREQIVTLLRSVVPTHLADNILHLLFSFFIFIVSFCSAQANWTL